MKLLYFFDRHIKPLVLKRKKICNPQDTAVLGGGISCIRQEDVNFWFYAKGEETIAFDAGHLNCKDADAEFSKIRIDPQKIRHLFLTHVDVDHAGGIDLCGKNIFPNAKVYLGKEEEQYLTGKMHRMIKFGIKIKNCVKIGSGYRLLEDKERIKIGDISITALHIPGHTLGHLCYLVDERILISGDCLAIKEKKGYSFFEFFTQYPEMNKQSLHKLREALEGKTLDAVCTGHSGILRETKELFACIDESA
ncbi:MAG: MBL fold metallo-hydrolase [Johnsonella sp.]|nr:MBL fold metallo-hydrolase [Johnsonella sp.]